MSNFTNYQTNGSNEAFLVAFDKNYINSDNTLGRTYNLDLGVTYAQLAADPTKALIAYENAGKNLSLDSNWSSFLKLGAGEKTQNIVYGIFAAGDMSGTKYQGTFTSGTQTVAPPVEANTTPPGSVTITWKGQIDAINLHEAEIARGGTATSSLIKSTDAANTGQADTKLAYRATFEGGAPGQDNFVNYGSTNNFYFNSIHLGSYIKRGHTYTDAAIIAQSDITKVGAFTLSGNTLKYVPESVVSTNKAPTFSNFTSTVVTTKEDTQSTITFDNLITNSDAKDADGSVTAFDIKSVTSGTLLIGADAATATAWDSNTNFTIDATHQAIWTPDLNATGTLSAFTAVALDNGGLESSTPVQATVTVNTVNQTPTLTSFTNTVASINENTQSDITFDALVANSDASDVDGNVAGFYIKSVTSGTLLIGADAATATAWDSNTNFTVDATHQAFWTPDLNASGVLNAFTAVAVDNAGLGSVTPIQASVHVNGNINNTHPVAPKIVTDSSYQWTVDPQITMTISTSGNANASGSVVVELQPQQAPTTVANMLAYVNSGFYSDVIFHRVISGFMIQAGLASSDGYIKNPIYSPITLESNNGLSNLSGTIAMARTSDPNSASSQFFINTVDNQFLNYTNSANLGYAVFGKMLSGMNVVTSISQVPTGSTPDGQYQDVPLTTVIINAIRQTVVGSAITTSTTLHISDIASGATWSYSLDSGKTWLAGVGAAIILPTGKYTVNQIEVKQTAAGVDSTISKFTSALEVNSSYAVNQNPNLTTFTHTVASINENTQSDITFDALVANSDASDVDGNVAGFYIKSVTSGTLLIGADAATATAWDSNTNFTVDATHQAFWTPDLNASGVLNAFTAVAVDNAGLGSVTPIQATVAVTFVNYAPTFTNFAAPVATGNEDSQISITLDNLKAQGNEADNDGTVNGFVIKELSSGSLLIGSSLATATAWNASSNNSIDATHLAFWTPATNANGTLNAFTAVAKDDGGLESATPVQATVSVTEINDLPTGAVKITGTPTQNQILTASNTLADVDGLGTITYQWQANGVSILGANKPTYTLGQTEVGKTVTVKASYTDGHGHNESVLSSATSKVQVAISPGITFSNTANLTTTEAGGTAAFGVALKTAPHHDVVLTLTSNDATEGMFASTQTTTQTLTFTPTNWNQVQTVTLKGVDDKIVDGNVDYTISTKVTSDDLNYDGMRSGTGLAIANIHVTNNDDDQPDEIYGDDGGHAINDYLIGGNGASDIYGLLGRDELHGGNGDDRLYGGYGDDVLYGEADNDQLEGEQGDDKLYGGDGNDTLNGGTGNDSLTGGNGDDVLDGGTGKDSMDGGNGSDTYYVDNSGDVVSDSGTTGIDTVNIASYISSTFTYTLGAGIENAWLSPDARDADLTGNTSNNTLTGNSFDNQLAGGDGTDTLNGGAGNDTLTGGNGSDQLDGGAGVDNLLGGDGSDTLNGGTSNDSLNGGTGNDELIGGAGNDTINGGVGFDCADYSSSTSNLTINLKAGTAKGNDIGTDSLTAIEEACAGSGNDVITGSDNNNQLEGAAGNDTLNGGTGNDTLNGGTGNDSLVAGNGNDIVFGGAGLDILSGGIGADSFDFNAIAESAIGKSHDIIKDFTHSQADKIDLIGIDANSKVTGDQAFSYLGSKAFDGKAGEIHYISGVLSGDINGDKVADFEIAITLVGTTSLVVGDFVL